MVEILHLQYSPEDNQCILIETSTENGVTANLSRLETHPKLHTYTISLFSQETAVQKLKLSAKFSHDEATS